MKKGVGSGVGSESMSQRYGNYFRYPEAQEAANSVLQFDNLNADAIFVRGLCLYYEVKKTLFSVLS
jgi:hypothetical protein